MAFDAYKAHTFMRLNCRTWDGARSDHHPSSQAETDREREARAWAYARTHHVSYQEAVRQLFDDDE